MTKSSYKNKKIIIIGGHEQASLCLEYFLKLELEVLLCICRLDDNGIDDIFPSLKKRCIELNINYIQPKKINSKSVFLKIKKLNPDIMFSLQNNMLIDNRLINFFNIKLGIINVHYAPLPKYAGYWPEMWAIWNKEKTFGVTMHYLSSGIDKGDIIDQYPLKISPNEFRESLYNKCSKTCFKMIKKNLKFILEKKVKTRKQNMKIRSYYKKSLPNNGYIDLNWSKEKIERFYRAISFKGYVGPKIKIKGKIISSFIEDYPFFKKKYLFNEDLKNK